MSARTAYMVETTVVAVIASFIFTPFAGLCILAYGMVTVGSRG